MLDQLGNSFARTRDEVLNQDTAEMRALALAVGETDSGKAQTDSLEAKKIANSERSEDDDNS